MSDPVTNAQIEDVLSSIRRLVSDDGRFSDPAAETESTVDIRSDPAPEKPDRLVLTPALRVTEAERPTQGVEEATAQEPDEAPGAAAPWAAQGATLFGVASGETATEDPAADAPEGGKAGDSTGALSEPAEAPDEQPQPEVAAIGEDGVAAESIDAADEPAPGETAWDGFEGEEADIMDQPPTFHSTRAENLSAKIEALEAVIGRTRDQWEPDGTSDDAYAGTPVEGIGWHEVEEVGAEQAAEASDDLATDEAVIDEDSLRELVAEIVRQELQGALGERITRNVRKLVRREIHRVLAAQDLD